MTSVEFNFDKELAELKKAGFTDKQVKAIKHLIASVVVAVGNRHLAIGQRQINL